MKYIIIKLKTKEDLSSAKYICERIGDMIEDGYTSGMGSPVDWSIEKAEHVEIK